MGTLSADLDEMSSEASMSEEKAQRAMIDAARYNVPNGLPFIISYKSFMNHSDNGLHFSTLCLI